MPAAKHSAGAAQVTPAQRLMHADPSALSTYPGAQLVQTDLPAELHVSGLVQFSMGVHAVHTVGTLVLRQ